MMYSGTASGNYIATVFIGETASGTYIATIHFLCNSLMKKLYVVTVATAVPSVL